MNAHLDPSRLLQLPETIPRHDALHLTEGGSLARIDLNGQTCSLLVTLAGKLGLSHKRHRGVRQP